MAVDEQRRGWTNNPSIQLTLAGLFLILGAAWLFTLRPDGAMYWVFAIGSLAAGAVWLVRGVKQALRWPH